MFRSISGNETSNWGTGWRSGTVVTYFIFMPDCQRSFQFKLLTLRLCRPIQWRLNECKSGSHMSGKKRRKNFVVPPTFWLCNLRRHSRFSDNDLRPFCFPVAWNNMPLYIRLAPTFINVKTHAQDTFVFKFLLCLLTVSRVRAANIVRRPCSDSSHIIALYKLSFYYFLLLNGHFF